MRIVRRPSPRLISQRRGGIPRGTGHSAKLPAWGLVGVWIPSNCHLPPYCNSIIWFPPGGNKGERSWTPLTHAADASRTWTQNGSASIDCLGWARCIIVARVSASQDPCLSGSIWFACESKLANGQGASQHRFQYNINGTMRTYPQCGPPLVTTEQQVRHIV
jgi:hypothetical protein